MARYGAERKQATRQRIIETAGRRFKRDGIDGSGVATLMKDAELTNGAFYAHFSSKDELVATVIATQLAEQGARFAAQAAASGGLEGIIREYLSLEHRDDPEGGCPSAALLDEIGRTAEQTRQAYTDGLLALVDGIAAQIAPRDPSSVRMSVIGVVGLLIGTLQLSRAITDRALAAEILENGMHIALAQLRPDAEDATAPLGTTTSRK